MTTEFDLEFGDGKNVGSVKIIGQRPQHKPYVTIWIKHETAYIKDKDLERFAVNILKSIRSKKLKTQ